jgi:glycosyltransferase involved in cell wall biosynthesis
VTATNQRPLLISVVIPTRNRANYLASAIESVLQQDYPHIECIVADGGSTDGTHAVLERYGDRISWFSEPDSGAFEAINKGWRRCHGEVLAWLNADDRWEPGAAAMVASVMQEHPEADVVYGDCGVIDAHGNRLEDLPARVWDLKAAVLRCDHIINQAASFIRRSTIERVGYLHEAWCHDHDLWLRIGLAGGRFLPVPQRLASARVWDDNLGNDAGVVIPAKLELTRRFFATPDLPAELKRLQPRAMSNAWLRGLDYLSPTRRGDWPEIRGIVIKAVRADPFNLIGLIIRVAYFTIRWTPPLFATAKFLKRHTRWAWSRFVHQPT